nr:crosslink repair DNA glycosylase YcaQ family protein [Geomicrobium sediminis]
MVEELHVTPTVARQFLITKLLPHCSDALQTLTTLEAVQLDPVAVVERNHHLVFMNRNETYHTDDYGQLLQQKLAFEHFANAACLLPMEDYPLLKGVRERIRTRWQEEQAQYSDAMREVVTLLANEGPKPSQAFFSDRKVVGGWDHPTKATTKETTHALRILFECGEIQVSGRTGSTRHFALTEEQIPAALQHEAERISSHEADRLLLEKYMRAYRLIDPRDARFGWQKFSAAKRKQVVHDKWKNHELVKVVIEGASRDYYVLEEDAEELVHTKLTNERVMFLPPLDPLLWSRSRVEDLFGMTYRWEIYVPKAKRRYGPYTMPVLVDDQLIGRIDPWLDREKRVLHVRSFEGVAQQPRVRIALHAFAERLGAQDIHVRES